MNIHPWDLQRAAEFSDARSSFEARPDFQSLVSEAKSRGFRRITLAEQMSGGKVSAYQWRGGVWVAL